MREKPEMRTERLAVLKLGEENTDPDMQRPVQEKRIELFSEAAEGEEC